MKTPRRFSARARLARETWRLLFDFFIGTRDQREAVLRRYNLTPNDSRALFSLSTREGRTMGSLAGEWGCDASNATWIVDRLETRRLAARKAHASDRRVKLVSLTPKGAKTRARLLRRMHETPPALLALDGASLRALRAALAGLERAASRRRSKAVARRARSPATSRPG